MQTWLQIGSLRLTILLLSMPVGRYLANIVMDRKTWLDPVFDPIVAMAFMRAFTIKGGGANLGKLSLLLALFMVWQELHRRLPPVSRRIRSRAASRPSCSARWPRLNPSSTSARMAAASSTPVRRTLLRTRRR